MATIRVFFADDNEAILTELLESMSKEFQIVGTAEDGKEAIRGAMRLNPDVLVLDIAMPMMTGLQVASALREAGNHAKILFLTILEEPEYISAAFLAGASGYVSKQRLGSDLAVAIREVFEGRFFLSPTLRI